MASKHVSAERRHHSAPAKLGWQLALGSLATAAVLFLIAVSASRSLQTSQLFVFIAIGFASVLVPFVLALYAIVRTRLDLSSGRETDELFLASFAAVTLPPSIYAVFLVAGASSPFFPLLLFLGPVSPQLMLLAINITLVRTRVSASWIPSLLSAMAFATPVVVWIDVLTSGGFGALKAFAERTSSGNLLLAYLFPFIATYALTGVVDLLVYWTSRRDETNRVPVGRGSIERV